MTRTAPDRLEIARMLREIRMLLDLTKENRFRARAYETGARALERTSEDLGKLMQERRLTEIPGIGSGLAATIAEIWETGDSKLLRELRGGVEAGAVELSRIRGMTPKRLAAIQTGLGIASVDQLKSACERGLVRSLKGFGEKTEQALLEAIRTHEEGSGAALLSDALEIAQALEDHVRRIPECVAVATSGALRRFEELVSEIDVVAAFHDARGACDGIAKFPLAARVERQTPDACVLRLADGLRANVSIVSPPEFCATLHRTTGSAQHLRRLAELGAARTPRPRPHAQPTNGEAGGCHAEEAAIYAKAGLPFIPPELREDAGEIEAGLAGENFDDLVEVGDIRGMVHCHTTHSDGRNTIEEMARAAEDRGMAYITITDHSPTASYAGGLDLDHLKRQWDEIERVRERVSITIMKGTESDILADGSLDYPLDVLRRFDVVIASVHQRHKLDEDAMTGRLVAAMRQPVFKVWGHALGRLLKRRDPIACRVEDVLDAIASSRAAIEINGDPHRLDLAPRWIREARKRSIPFVISTDAHSISDLDNLRFGVGMARRGGVRRGEVLNTLDTPGFARAVSPR